MKNLIYKHWKIILIILSILVIAFLIKQNNRLRTDVLVSKNLLKQAKDVPEDIPQPSVKVVNKEGGGSIVKQEIIRITEVIPENVKNALRESYLKDTIIAALKKENGGKDVKIDNIVRLLGIANKKLAEKDLINVAENEAKGVLEWQTPFYYSKVNIAEKSNDTRYKIITDYIQVTEKGKGFLNTGIFPSKTEYLIGTSPDPSATFDGMLQSRTKIQDRKDIFNLSAEFGGNYLLKPDNTLTLFGGLRITINPDGKWQPSISGQYFFDPISGQLRPIVQAKVSYTIFE